MTVPPTYNLHDLGPQAQMMAKNCNNERMAMILQYVAIGSMIVMAGVAASQVLKDVFGSHRSSRQATAGQDEHAGQASASDQDVQSFADRRQPRCGSRAEGREPDLPDGS